MPRAKKGQQKVPIVKRRQVFAPLGVIQIVENYMISIRVLLYEFANQLLYCKTVL